ncbi:hypothetical protein [Thioalkalivibrio denitrificans]|uniref:hypothetical protein n=1 Tax=Thioalkalivibrio denitrificans TaxID=108003 RepID=UPI00111583AB|nr:hypothetical protein [Thioalkalivibrio denitrificans]
MRGISRLRYLAAGLFVVVLAAGTAQAQEDDEVTIRVIPPDMELPEAVTREIVLPETASDQARESAAFGLDTANQARERREGFGRDVAAEARENRERFRNIERPGPPNQ